MRPIPRGIHLVVLARFHWSAKGSYTRCGLAGNPFITSSPSSLLLFVLEDLSDPSLNTHCVQEDVNIRTIYYIPRELTW